MKLQKKVHDFCNPKEIEKKIKKPSISKKQK